MRNEWSRHAILAAGVIAIPIYYLVAHFLGNAVGYFAGFSIIVLAVVRHATIEARKRHDR